MFKTFPEFSKLNLSDKGEYERYISDYPPLGDITFAGVMVWWNNLGSMSVATLNDNLVVPYWLPGDDKNSGLSLIGTNKIDKSICTIFDHQKDQGDKPRLVNVPEFVIGNIRFPELFKFKSHKRFDEYLLAVRNLYPLENWTPVWRHKVRRKLSALEGRKVEIRRLDLNLPGNEALLLGASKLWQSKNVNGCNHEEDVLKACLTQAYALGLECIGLFVDNHMLGFGIFRFSGDKKYVISYYFKATNESALGYERLMYYCAEWLTLQKVEFINMGSDYGLLRLRMLMLTLGPVNFFRKYTIEPAD